MACPTCGRPTSPPARRLRSCGCLWRRRSGLPWLPSLGHLSWLNCALNLCWLPRVTLGGHLEVGSRVECLLPGLLSRRHLRQLHGENALAIAHVVPNDG